MRLEFFPHLRRISDSGVSVHKIKPISSNFPLFQRRNEREEIRQQLAMLDIEESELLVVPKETEGSQGALMEETKVSKAR